MTNTHRSLPTEINAIRFTGDNVREIWEHFESDEGIDNYHQGLSLTTLDEVEVPCPVGHWVVAEPKRGRYYPVDPEVFAARYSEINGPDGDVWAGRHPSVRHFEKVFGYDHLPVGKMRSISQECAGLAEFMVENLPDNDELVAGLRALWEAKNCFVLLASGKFADEWTKS